ncbi:putative Undecaprenyl phosphate-alpha-4-amino-4-deoxy-L-arabinose arabinosyl transferase [Waddlia chondrophila 2032/99]|uniref:Putative Undecaprenyl phosphate-alpha-4-amino-4-deoxy-L-arabinose arabinosyl transferase n=1 Tax=Waddlia chondrophila 2032/99 TaxID=765953 RepID=F8LFG2_9BACT|nr:putative Undecaprenyl phosphate-alpha-4-amino-4-deoxy-L-arabinose arabinosyl transferase [Waddlia chondrophila 2032/99]
MRRLCLFLGVKALFALFFIHSGLLGLGPDEAQYWTWSKALDWGYYSKPPGIAWQIWMGTQIFGDTELGVRFMAVVLNFLIPIAIYFLAKSCRLSESAAFWAAIAFAFSPLGILGSLLATTDGGLVLFWTLGCLVVVQGRVLLLGFVIACGALFKWPIYLLWVFVPFFRKMRSLKLLWGVAISLLGLLPSVIWNWQHDWATFQHVFNTMKGGHAHTASSGNFWDFVGAQAALISPILFILLILAVISLFRRLDEMRPSLLFCGAVTAILLLIYSLMAIKQKMQGNWVVFAYPTGFVLLSWYALERAKKWLIGGVGLSAILTVVALWLPFSGWLPYKMNPFKHNLAWERMEEALLEAGYNPKNDFLFSDKYQMSSLLSFYSPEKKRAYFLNLQGVRKNQFSYWPSMADEQLNQNGYYVAAENFPHLEQLDPKQHVERLSPYFSTIDLARIVPLIKQDGKVVKALLIVRCRGYRGQEPKDLALY